MAQERRHVALIGMPGVGKSRIARELAAVCGTGCTDLDTVIQERSAMSIADIFATCGEAEFREREHSALADALESSEPTVISTGGGLVTHQDSRELLSREAEVVLIDVPEDVLIERLRASKNKRPLLAGDLEANLRSLRTRREALYLECADHVCPAGDVESSAVVNRVRSLVTTQPFSVGDRHGGDEPNS